MAPWYKKLLQLWGDKLYEVGEAKDQLKPEDLGGIRKSDNAEIKAKEMDKYLQGGDSILLAILKAYKWEFAANYVFGGIETTISFI
jgi:hypothetical protein